jgi:hypothetical protein
MNSNSKTTRISSDSYEDVKNKTIQWCQVLKNNNIYSDEQYNKCISSFIDLGVGTLPQDMKPPTNGNEYEYSLYNHTSGYSQQGIIPTDTNNKIMLSTSDDLFLSSNNAGVISLVKKEDAAILQELQWSLVKNNNTQFSLLSTYKNFLSAENNGLISASNPNSTNSTIWIISKINDIITLENLQYPGLFLTISYDKTTAILTKNEGTVATQWNISIVLKPGEALVVPFDITSYTSEKQKLLKKLELLIRKKYEVLAEYALVDSLVSSTNDNYNNILTNITNNINNINSTYNDFINDLKAQYNVPGTDISSLSSTERETLQSYTDENVIMNLQTDIIPRPIACLKSDPNAPCDYDQVQLVQAEQQSRLNELNSIKKQLLNMLKKIEKDIKKADQDITNWISKIQIASNANLQTISNNNVLLTQQASDINAAQSKLIALSATQEITKTTEEQARINQQIATAVNSQYTNQKRILFGLMFLSVGVSMFMTYRFIKKIMGN